MMYIQYCVLAEVLLRPGEAEVESLQTSTFF